QANRRTVASSGQRIVGLVSCPSPRWTGDHDGPETRDQRPETMDHRLIDPSSPNHQIAIIKDHRLARSDRRDGCVEVDGGTTVLERRYRSRGRGMAGQM